MTLQADPLRRRWRRPCQGPGKQHIRRPSYHPACGAPPAASHAWGMRMRLKSDQQPALRPAAARLLVALVLALACGGAHAFDCTTLSVK